jgi:hypothetical protein
LPDPRAPKIMACCRRSTTPVHQPVELGHATEQFVAVVDRLGCVERGDHPRPLRSRAHRLAEAICWRLRARCCEDLRRGLLQIGSI